MSSENEVAGPVIQLQHVAKKYPIYDQPAHKLVELMTFRRKQMHREFWALEDLDLKIDQGETLGILGQNGSGKSTLLQIVAGILAPTRGICRVQGQVAALLELGTGFNPEFTGRENVLMSAGIQGLSRGAIESRMSEILDFAEIGEFIDQPVKTYSSGMFVRLAFSVAIHVDPDILLIDEALSVGDLVFQHQCVNRIRKMQREGTTILFVSHDLQAITQFCQRAILLDAGRKLADEGPEEVVQKYRSLVFERERGKVGPAERLSEPAESDELPRVGEIPYVQNRFGNKGAEITGIILRTPEGFVATDVKASQAVELLIGVAFRHTVENPIVGFTVRDRLGTEVTASNTSYEGLDLPAMGPGQEITVGFQFQLPSLRPGSYTISPAVSQGNIWEHQIEDWVDNAYIINIVDTGLVYGNMRWQVKARYRKLLDSR